MGRWLFGVAVSLGLLGLAACASQEETKPAPAAPPAQAGWEAEWEQVLAAAKREGKLAVSGPDGAWARRAMTKPFEDKYGIKVEYQGFQGPEFVTRFREERKANKHIWDVIVAGTSTVYRIKKGVQGALEPIESAMILPEVKEPKNWKEGRLDFWDEDKIGVATTPYQRSILVRNTELVKPGELKSIKDLLDPKWKGKIVARDPRVGGPGQATFLFFYMHPDLGTDFIRALIEKQDITFTRNDVQALEWTARGQYPLNLGYSSTNFAAMKREAPTLPMEAVPPTALKEGGDVSTGTGNISFPTRAPHPNAAKVFINWWLSKDGQAIYSEASDHPSWRVDVPWKGAKWELPLPTAPRTHTAEAQELKAPLVKLLKELIK